MKEPNNQQQPQYPNSQQPYPYSQQPQYPNSQQMYPNSQQPYPNSQQYPYSQYQYPGPQKKGLAIWQVAAIMGGIIFFLIIIFILLVTVRHQQSNSHSNNLRDYSAYESYEVPVRKLEVDGVAVSLPQRMLDINGFSYIAIENFADVLGYETKNDEDNQQTTVSLGSTSITFTDGIDKAIIKNGNKTTTETLDDRSLMFEEEGMYVPLRSMQTIFDLKEVNWDEDDNTVVIVTDAD